MPTKTFWRTGLATAALGVWASLAAAGHDPCCRWQGCVPAASPTFGFYPTVWRPFPPIPVENCAVPVAPGPDAATVLPAIPVVTPPAAAPAPAPAPVPTTAPPLATAPQPKPPTPLSSPPAPLQVPPAKPITLSPVSSGYNQARIP